MVDDIEHLYIDPESPFEPVRVIIHSTATPPSFSPRTNQLDRAYRTLGYFTIPFHWVVGRDGTVSAWRPHTVAAPHTSDWCINKHAFGILMVGGAKEGAVPNRYGLATRLRRGVPITSTANNYTLAQRAALGELLLSIRDRFGISDVVGARDLPKLSSTGPGFNVRAFKKLVWKENT